MGTTTVPAVEAPGVTTPESHDGGERPAEPGPHVELLTLFLALFLAATLLGSSLLATTHPGPGSPAAERPDAFAAVLVGSAIVAAGSVVAFRARLYEIATGRAGAGASVWADVLAFGIVHLLALFGCAALVGLASALAPDAVPDVAGDDAFLFVLGFVAALTYVVALRRGVVSAPGWLTTETWRWTDSLYLFLLVGQVVFLHLGVAVDPVDGPAFPLGLAVGAVALGLRWLGVFVPDR